MSHPFTLIEQRYRDQVVEHYNRLSLTGLPEREAGLHGVPLEKVFVQLDTEVAQAGQVEPGLERARARLQGELEALKQTGKSERDGRVQQLQAEIERFGAQARQAKTVTLSVAEALHQYRRVVVIGGPGSGKTTLTHWLALIFARNCQALPNRLGTNFAESRLPILLELRRFANALSQPSGVPNLAIEMAQYISQHDYFAGTSAEFIGEQRWRWRLVIGD